MSGITNNQKSSRVAAKKPQRLISAKNVPNPQNPYSRNVNSSIFANGPQNYLPPVQHQSQPHFTSRPEALPPLQIVSSQQSIMTMQNIEALKSRSSRSTTCAGERHLRHESVLEAFLENSTKMPLHSAIEETIALTLNAATVTLWQDIPTLHVLYSDRISKTVNHSVGLVGFTFFSREVVKITNSSTHSAYVEEFDSVISPPGTPVILFPLWDANNNVCAVVEVTKDPKSTFFDDEDGEFIQFFIKKFKIYSPWLFNQVFPHQECIELVQLMEIEQYLILFQRKISDLFKCNKCEIWRYNGTTKVLQKFKKTAVKVDPVKAGIAGESLFKGCPINCTVNKMQSSYCAESDGDESEPVLSIPLTDQKMNFKYAVVLRSRKILPVFTNEDEKRLRVIAPYLVMALDNNEKFSNCGMGGGKNVTEHKCVQYMRKLNNMLTDGVNIDDIIKEAVEDIESLTQSDKTLLLTLDKQKTVLRARVATNMKNEIIISLKDKIIGETFKTGKIFNVSDAYEDLSFDSSFDLEHDYRTKSLATCPIQNNRKETVGVISLMNKKDGKPFSNNDLGWASIFGQYCGILIENQQMYEISSESSSQLRSFLNVSIALSSNKGIKAILNDIMQNGRVVIGADRASIFLLDEVVGALTVFIADGGSMPTTIPLSHGIAATSIKTKESIIVNDAYHDPRFNKLIDYASGFRTHSVLSVPIITASGRVLGVTEMINKANDTFTAEDERLLKSFSTFAAMLLESRHLKDITERGMAEIEMSKWIGEFERKEYNIPSKLLILAEKQKEINRLDFFCIEHNGIGLFKVAFYVFNSFHLLQKFQITNELFFTFLYKLREQYNEPPYHNWIHAIDVLQYFAYQIRVANFDNTLTGLELLAICVASICHDVGHEGFNNVYNVNAETPLGILFKDQSVMETHHCTLAIHIISQDECNIFHSLQAGDIKKIWSWVIQMILATDMAHHFKLVKNANDIMDQGPINLANESHRIMAMTMLMKVSDISNVSRPFEIAEKWCEILCEEFWRQGDLEVEQGLEISSPLNDRKNCNKPKGQIGFYNFICLPLYQAIARIFPELEVNVEAVKQNLEKWKELLAEQMELKKISSNEAKD